MALNGTLSFLVSVAKGKSLPEALSPVGFPLHPTGQNWVIHPSVGQGRGPPPLQFRGLCQCVNTTEVLLGRNGFGWMTKNGFPDFFGLRSPEFWSWSYFCLAQI